MEITKVTVQVPAGQYVLGDPCYTVPDENWGELLESCKFFENPIGEVKVDDKVHKVLAFRTAYGDGTYRDNKGNEYPVDAGLIGLVPIEYADLEQTGLESVIVDFKALTECSSDDEGTMYFGELKIRTGE